MVDSNTSNNSIIVRPSANYHPSIWDYDYIQSLRNKYVGETCTAQSNVLKEHVRMMLHKVVDPLEQLELIDILQRLGLSHHFEGEMKRILEGLHNNDQSGDTWRKENLYATTLKFRLLRQHGYNISQGVFNIFKDERGKFKACLCEETKGILSLYEASFLLTERENMLEELRNFATKHLQEYAKQNKDKTLSAMVTYALELPLHWRIIKFETRWFIDIYRSREDMNPILLKLAEMNFNMVQAVHQEDLKQVSRWWKNTRLGENLIFARDRLMELFFWSMDDVYDIYGTLDELKLFTDAIERWEINAMDRLPDYMRICFLILYNFVNEMAFDPLKEQGFHIIRYLKKAWADLCRSYLLEAKWYYSRYIPSLEEYLENAWISISTPVILMHAYFMITNPITKEALDCLEEYPKIFYWSSMILRLTDDLGTSANELKSGDVPKSIQCYMNETGASEKDAREYVKSLISTAWKKVNEERVASSPFCQTFIEIVMNLARMGHFMYQYGDGFGVADQKTKDSVLSLLIQPIPHSRMSSGNSNTTSNLNIN
nr:myrcene synthase, chloroplastic [Quercus suber]